MCEKQTKNFYSDVTFIKDLGVMEKIQQEELNYLFL